MSAFKRVLLIFLLVILTNVGTFLFAHWQCRKQLEGQEALLTQTSQRTQEVQAELDEAERELSRLRVWGDFISIQQDLNRVNDEINQLNFGNALGGVDEIIANLDSGAYGSTFREHRSRLLPILTDAKQALRSRSDRARGDLVRFNEEAFTVLSGLGSTRIDADPGAPEPLPVEDEAGEVPVDEPADEASEGEGEEDVESVEDDSPAETEDEGRPR